MAQSPSTAETSVANNLSEREREVLGLLVHGFSNADIAARLYLSEGTVRNYVSSIFDKLGVTDRTQAAVLALRYGMADFGDEKLSNPG
ncbi:MAG: response regulator transcription factor [Anaerolineales bacterium]|nr:response regulator transcription factor [Anaerolineales bacterium]